MNGKVSNEQSTRAAYDFLLMLVFDRLFERFDNLRVVSVENDDFDEANTRRTMSENTKALTQPQTA